MAIPIANEESWYRFPSLFFFFFALLMKEKVARKSPHRGASPAHLSYVHDQRARTSSHVPMRSVSALRGQTMRSSSVENGTRQRQGEEARKLFGDASSSLDAVGGTTEQRDLEEEETTTSASTPPQQDDDKSPDGAAMKHSRYLREIDRRAILLRLEHGETQSALAREFHVSRAAICNLNKHRDDVLARQHENENPFAKHPKKPRLRKQSPTTTNDAIVTNARAHRRRKEAVKARSSPPVAAPAGIVDHLHSQQQHLTDKFSTNHGSVHEITSHPVTLLLTTVQHQATPLLDFRRATARLIRLLVEEALARVPTKSVRVQLSDRARVSFFDGIAAELPTCGVTMEQGVSCPLFDTFHVLEPESPSGYIRIISTHQSGTADSPQRICEQNATEEPQSPVAMYFLDAHFPSSLTHHNVFLLDLVSSSGASVCAAIHKLLEHGAIECRITLVALFVSTEVIAKVHARFPRVHILTVMIDHVGVHATHGLRQRFESVMEQ